MKFKLFASVCVAAGLAFGLAGRERGHVVAGGLFLLFNLAHLYTYRKAL